MRSLLLAPLLLLTAAAPANERSFMVGNFDRLRVEGPFEIDVVPGSPGAVATGDRLALEQVTVRVDGDTMVVSPGPLSWRDPHEKAPPPPRVRISVPALEAVSVSGAAQVRVTRMRGRVSLQVVGSGAIDVAAVGADVLDATLTGTGSIRVAGTAGSARLRNYGSGAIDAAGLVAGDAVLNAGSSGSIRVEARYTARASALGSGGIDITGRPECTLRGPGPMSCTGTVRRP